MIDLFKKELIEFGTSRLRRYRPKNLDLYKEIQITRSLDQYSAKWTALSRVLHAKRQEMLSRPEATEMDSMLLHAELEKVVVAIRNKFTAAYPLNL